MTTDKMKRYLITFRGRRLGALGVFYQITTHRSVLNPEGAVLALTDEYEHIADPVVTDVETGESVRPWRTN